MAQDRVSFGKQIAEVGEVDWADVGPKALVRGCGQVCLRVPAAQVRPQISKFCGAVQKPTRNISRGLAGATDAVGDRSKVTMEEESASQSKMLTSGSPSSDLNHSDPSPIIML